MTEIPSTTAADAADNPEALPGIPVWRVGKPDAFLAADVSTARAALATIASDSAIGKHLGARSEGVRCVTHLFESHQPGYSGWVWFASLSRISRGKESTVNEVGMLPTEASVLAPAWVPWAERVRPEDQQDDAAEQAAGTSSERDATEVHDDGADASTVDSGAFDSFDSGDVSGTPEGDDADGFDDADSDSDSEDGADENN